MCAHAAYVAVPFDGVQVFKAKWNGIDTVAVKQLLAATTEKAKLDFLREVIMAAPARLAFADSIATHGHTPVLWAFHACSRPLCDHDNDFI